MSSRKPEEEKKKKVLVNARTGRVVEVAPPMPGREPAADRYTPAAMIGGEAWAISMRKHYADVPDHLWRIHGELYDLEGYLDLHPGGRLFLEKTKGQDCTEYFEAHHVREINPVLLRQLRVAAAPSAAPVSAPRFTYHETFTPVKLFVREYLARKKLGNGSTPHWAGALYTLVVAQFLVVFRLAVKRNSLPLSVLAGLLLTGVWGAAHNQIHRSSRFATNPWGLLRFALNLTGFSHDHQTITHALSHHQNVNTNYDVEAYETAEVLGLYWLTSDDSNNAAIFRAVPGLFVPFCSIVPIGTMAQRLVGRLLPGGGGLLHCDVLIPASMVAFACKHNGWRRGLLQCYLMWAAFGTWFIPASLTPHHGTSMDEEGAPASYHEGEPVGYESDFARHQIQSTRDHSPGLNHYLALVLFGHLNCHTVHHLFPTIDRVLHEPLLKALLEANPGGFRDVYYARGENNGAFTTLYRGIVRSVYERRYEPVA